MGFSGIIFDLDGTLLNTLDDIANSVNTVLIKHGFPAHSLEEYKYFIGHGIEELLIRALPSRDVDKETVKGYLSEVKEEYDKRWNEFTRPYDGINKLIDKLHSMGINMSILSNKPDAFTKISVEKYFGLERFNYVFGEREGIPKKPNPSSAMEIARLSEILPSNFLYLGDTDIDMKTASSAGMYAVGALWGFRKADELLNSGAKAIIKNPMDLIDLIN